MNAIKVFISSTIDELKDERLIAKRAIEHFGFVPIMFEDFGARPETAKRTYRQELKNSQVYLGIFYEEFSKPTHEEYSKALKGKKDILIYFKKSKKRDERLTKFMEEVKSRHLISIFEDVVELDGKIKKDLPLLASRAYLKTLPPISKKKLKAVTSCLILAIEVVFEELHSLGLLKRRKKGREYMYWFSEEFRDSFAENLADEVSKSKVKITSRGLRKFVLEAIATTLLNKRGFTDKQLALYSLLLYMGLTLKHEKLFLKGLLNLIKPVEDSNKKL